MLRHLKPYQQVESCSITLGNHPKKKKNTATLSVLQKNWICGRKKFGRKKVQLSSCEMMTDGLRQE